MTHEASANRGIPDQSGSLGGLALLGTRLSGLDDHSVIAALGFLCLFAANFTAPTDPDFWWHLRTGRLIVENGAIPPHDIFSYTAYGKPWIIPEWLAEVVMSQIYSAGGYITLVAVFSAIVTGAYFVLYRLLLNLSIDRTLALTLVAWAAVIRLSAYAPRPQLFTFLFFSVALHLLFTFKHTGRARLWLLPLIMVPWVNLHGGYIVGLLLVGIFAAGEFLNRVSRRPGAPTWPLIATGVATSFAALANPYGFDMLLEPLKYATTDHSSMRYITEWQSPDFHSYLFVPFALAIVFLMVVGSRGRIDFTHALIVGTFTIMALQSQRHILLFALATVPVLAIRLKELGLRLSTEGGRSNRMNPRLCVALITVVPIFVAAVLVASPYSQARPTPNIAEYPAGAVAYLKEHRHAGNIFNAYNWGGYLLNELYPDYPVFIDGRSDFYGDAVVEEYAQVANIGPKWLDVLEKYQVTTVLVEREAALDVLLSSQADWQVVYEGPVERILVLRDRT